jgi:hypothetical protein
MRHRSLLIVPLCLACVALGAMLNRPATGQASAPGPIGRFSQWATPQGNDAPYVVVLDTATGRCWSHRVDGNGDWNSFGPHPGIGR